MDQTHLAQFVSIISVTGTAGEKTKKLNGAKNLPSHSPNSTVNARWCFVLFLFFLVNFHYTESPACKLNVAVFSSSSLLPEKLVCSCTAVGHTFCLAVCRNGLRCSTCLAIWSSRLRLVMVPASFSWTCGRWVSCGPCVVSWPQPAATSRGSGSHPSQFVATRLLWWGSWKCKIQLLPCDPSMSSQTERRSCCNSSLHDYSLGGCCQRFQCWSWRQEWWLISRRFAVLTDLSLIGFQLLLHCLWNKLMAKKWKKDFTFYIFKKLKDLRHQ